MEDNVEVSRKSLQLIRWNCYELEDVWGEKYHQMCEHETTKRYINIVNRYHDQISAENESLSSFWLSYIDMVDILLCTIYAARAGKWSLLLECIRDIVEYAFPYDNHNYARYLSPFVAEMLQIEHSYPDVYEEFINGNFVAQLSDVNSFGKVELDKVIEVTINRDTKTNGGTTSFSKSNDAVNRWSLNAPYREDMHRCLHELLQVNKKKSYIVI